MKLGEKLAKEFRSGEIIGLEGELGTGKTTLIKGIAKGLGIKKNITSPTFVLMKLYNLKHQASGIRQLCHVDAYRVEGAEELIDIGVMEYIDDLKTIVIIEWAEKVKTILPNDAIWIKMKHGENESERIVEIN